MKTVCVVGAGGVGGYFGAKLAQNPHVQLTLLLRPHSSNYKPILQNGLRVRTPTEDIRATPRIATTPDEVGHVDYVLVCCKTYDLERLAPTLLPLCRPASDDGAIDATAVIPLLNGLDAPAKLADALGAPYVLGGLCLLVSYIEEPGVIRYVSGSKENAITFGEMPQIGGSLPTESARARWLKEAFLEVGVGALVPADETGGVWNEMLVKFNRIVPFSTITAVCRSGIGFVIDEPKAKALLLQVLKEGIAVSKAHGGILKDSFEDDYIASLSNLKKDAVASLTRDMVASRPSELHEQLGAMLRLADEKSVSAPAIAFAYAALLPQENAARAKTQALASPATSAVTVFLSHSERRLLVAAAVGCIVGLVVARRR